jgi:chaperonin GroES
MNIKPLDDRVLIQQVEEEEKVGSIIIPDSAKEKPRMGKVVAVGTDEDLQEHIKVNDTIVYSKYAGDEIKLGDDEYLLVSRGDILGVVEN